MDTSDVIRILIVDDQDIVRHGLALIIKHQSDFAIVGQATNGDEAVRLAHEQKPDIVLMDIQMPRMNGIRATQVITAELPETKVIILTTYDVDGYVFDGIRAGVSGYLLKDTSSERLYEVIRSVYRGESQIDPVIAGKVMEEFRRLSVTPPERVATPEGVIASTQEEVIEQLTEREMDVLRLIAKGLSNKDIAVQLYLSEGTVRNYVSVIMEKMHANDRIQVVIKASRRKWVKLD
jgi:DNA-binding NarL/FixJ family response regulator